MKKTNKNINKKYIIVAALVAILAVGVLVVSKPNTQTPVQPPIQAKPVAPVAEVVTGRIDLSTKPYTEEVTFTVYKGVKEQPVKEAAWMPKQDMRGYTLQNNGKAMSFVIKTQADVEVSIALRGPSKKDERGKRIPQWVDFISLTIDGKEILTETKAVWHNKPFTYTINAKADETYNVVAKWQKHEESAE